MLPQTYMFPAPPERYRLSKYPDWTPTVVLQVATVALISEDPFAAPPAIKRSEISIAMLWVVEPGQPGGESAENK
jgi:hypothetical protein